MMNPVRYLLVFGLIVSIWSCDQSRAQSVAGGGSPPVIRLPNFVTLAKHLQPAVVSVSALLGEEGGMGGLAPEHGEEMTGGLFGIPVPDAPGAQRSQGSGFIIRDGGVILTNAHVIEGSSKITVRLFDKREFQADLIGKDPHTDVALIRITAGNLPTLPLGDSDRLQVGEWVMAVGNPFGLESSVSSGIVSAKGRHLGDAYDRLIQTDVNLNPGSSGGPLIAQDGKVVGISKAIVSQGGANLGISFATPINLVKEILPELENSGKVIRAWAGLGVQEITPALAQALGLEKPHGALVAGVAPGGPAERGGISVGDVITELDGKHVTDALELPLWIARMPVGKRVAVKVRRDREELRLDLTVAQLPETSGRSNLRNSG
jgi:serine protease Do